MNKEITQFTEDIGKIYIKIAELRAKKHVLKAKIWEAKKIEMDKKILKK